MKSWSNTTIWITGASSGIGRALTFAFLERGATVIGSARSKKSLREVSHHKRYVPLCCDVTDKDSLAQATQAMHEQYGHLDIVIANAGICEYIEMPNFDTAVMEHVMHVNYIGCINTIEAALPLLRKSPKPYLLAMSSSNAYLGLPRSQAYGPSKSAIYNLMQSMKADLSGSIDVSVICPGFVESPLTDKNDFSMPARISAEQAAEYIIKGMSKRRFDINFPKRLTLLMKLLALLPAPILFRLTQKLSRSKAS